MTVRFLLLLILFSLRLPAAVEKPNVVFIMADDLGWGDLGSYGQKNIRTPRLDRMAAEGVRCTDYYCGVSVCAPSRCVLMTGRHSGHATIRANGSTVIEGAVTLRDEDVTLAESLKAAGYATAWFGKWGLGEAGSPGLPQKQGFDFYFGYLNQTHAHNYWPEWLLRNGERVLLPNKVAPGPVPGSGVATERREYSGDRIAEEAIAWLRQNKQRPFFLYLPFTLPHVNNEASHSNLKSAMPAAHAARIGLEVPDAGAYEKESWPDTAKGYAAMVTRLDSYAGRLLDELKALGLDEKTIVFFTSDNGPSREAGNEPDFHDSNGPWRGIKRDVYEGGLRVPMIVRWPGKIAACSVSSVPWAAWDVFPTLTKLCGAENPPVLDGTDMLPVLTSAVKSMPDRPLYWEMHEPKFRQAVRLGAWKLVRTAPPQVALELYNLAADPGESKDLAVASPDKVRELDALLHSMHAPSPAWPCALDAAQ